MESLTITRIWRGDKETRFGTKASVAIMTTQYGDKWLSTFKTEGTEKWAVGDTVDVYVEKKGEYVNFSLKPTEGSANTALEVRISALEAKVFGKMGDKDHLDTPPDDF